MSRNEQNLTYSVSNYVQKYSEILEFIVGSSARVTTEEGGTQEEVDHTSSKISEIFAEYSGYPSVTLTTLFNTSRDNLTPRLKHGSDDDSCNGCDFVNYYSGRL